MIATIISDVHVTDSQDVRYHLLINFLKHKLSQEADEIILLGDIFEIMSGPHKEYYVDFPEFFSLLAKYIEKGKKIKFFEGNHDFHIRELFHNYLRSKKLPVEKFEIIPKEYILNLDGKKIYLSHGDDLLRFDYVYKAYKYFLQSRIMKLFMDRFVSYSFLSFVGNKASSLSKKRRTTKVFDEVAVRNKFRDGAVRVTVKNNVDILIAGHSHIKDDYTFTTSKGKVGRYINNGYALESLSFIAIDIKKISFHDLKV